MDEQNNDLFGRMWVRKIPFFVVFFIVVTLTYALLVIIDFIPEPVSIEEIKDTDSSTVQVQREDKEEKSIVEVEKVKNPLPTRIIIDEIGTDVQILNPNTLDIAKLDEALLDGVVRHPQTADFEDTGSMLIFGHSSYLPNVFNSNFQAFNGVQDLTWGDKVRVQSADMEYVYRVDRVYQSKASDTVIDNSRGEAKLTIVTCNSFATTDDRYILEATLVSERPL